MRTTDSENTRSDTRGDSRGGEARGNDEFGGNKQGMVKRSFFRRQRGCPLSGEGAPEVDYKNTSLLRRYVSEKGRILPRRITSISAKKQRQLTLAIKRARVLALLPFKAS
jgi:small subunit ribosomal protein S18